MHDWVEKGLDFLRGPEEGITGMKFHMLNRRTTQLSNHTASICKFAVLIATVVTLK